jgi:hypothetical protein
MRVGHLGKALFEGIKLEGTRPVSPATCLKLPARILFFLRFMKGIWWVAIDEKCV